MKVYLQISTFFLFFIHPVSGQVSQEWASRYSNGTGVDQANALAVDDDGNVYVTGSSADGGFGTEDYATVKYNPAGVEQWVKRYNGTGSLSDIAHSIFISNDGFIYVTGESTASNGSPDYLTIKYDSDGDTIWTARYNGSRNGKDIAYSIAVNDSGNVYITGQSQGLVSTHGIFDDYVTVKYNSEGVQQWAVSYNGPGGDFDAAYSIVVDDAGYAVVTGGSGGGSTGSADPYEDFATIKYNAAGTLQWVKRKLGAGTANDRAKQIIKDARGNLFVTGRSDGAEGYDYLTVKYNSAGDEQWAGRYDQAGSADEANSVAVDDSGNVYVTGRSYSGVAEEYNIITIKYDSSGTEKWAVSFNGTANDDDEGISVKVDDDFNIYVGGYASAPATSADFATLKYNPAGVLQWSILYNNGASAGSDDRPTAMSLDNSGNIHLTGMSALDYATVKYSSTVALDDFKSELISSDNYPNPFENSTRIGWDLSETGSVDLRIFDSSGKEICRPVNEKQSPGSHEILFNSTSLSPGMYYYRLSVNDKVLIKKIVCLKGL